MLHLKKRTMDLIQNISEIKDLENGLYLLKDEGFQDPVNFFFNIKNFNYSDSFWIYEDLGNGLYLLGKRIYDKEGTQCFLNTSDCSQSRWFNKDEDLGNGLHLLSQYDPEYEYQEKELLPEKWLIDLKSFVQSPDFQLYEDLENGLYLLTHEWIDAGWFFRKEDLKLSIEYDLDRYSVEDLKEIPVSEIEFD